MARRTFTEILTATRQRFIENLTLQAYYGLDASLTWDEQFSKSSFEGALTYVSSYVVFLYESIVYDKADEVMATIATEHEFSVPWYADLALAFQLGDEVVYNDTTQKHDYAVVDETKKIVKYSQVRRRQISGVTKLQVFATKANKVALTVDELNAFTAYVTKKGAAGDHFQFISLAPDQLVLNMKVYYDPQILKSTGEKLSDGTKPVDLAVSDYLNSIKYAGAFNRTKQTDSIQSADGVIDVVLENVLLNGDLNTDREFESASGFFVAQTINVTYISTNAD